MVPCGAPVENNFTVGDGSCSDVPYNSGTYSYRMTANASHFTVSSWTVAACSGAAATGPCSYPLGQCITVTPDCVLIPGFTAYTVTAITGGGGNAGAQLAAGALAFLVGALAVMI